jgi:predicted RNase H-like HicB family nuclease
VLITASDLTHKYKAQLWRGPSGLYVCWATRANAGSQGRSPKEAVAMAQEAIAQYLNLPPNSVDLDVEEVDEAPTADIPDDGERQPRGERRLIMPKGDVVDPTLLERLVLWQAGISLADWRAALAATE